MEIDRRQFLRGEFATREGRARALRRQQSLGPLPPGFAGRLEPSDCSDCEGSCATACEPGVIRRHDGNHRLAGSPYLDFSDAACTFCGECMHACPRDLGELPAASSLVVGTAALDVSNCMAFSDVVCISCRFACHRQALRADARNRPWIDAARCNGCGDCVRVCPPHAIEIVATSARLPA